MARKPTRSSAFNYALRRLVVNAATHDRYPPYSHYSHYLRRWLAEQSQAIWTL